jgi:hypothetical protein
LYLSLQAGGAAVIRYLQPALSPLLHPITGYYAALATEAAKPFDFQLWLSVLQPTIGFNPSWEPNIIGILADVRDALLCHEARPASLERAVNNLCSLIQSLYDLPAPVISAEQLLEILPLSWPVALLLRLENHQRRLLSP